MQPIRYLILAVLLVGFAAAGPPLDPRALSYRVRATTIELDGTTQRLSGDVALVVSGLSDARLDVRADTGIRDLERVVLSGDVRAELRLPPGALPGVVGAAQLRCRELSFDPAQHRVTFVEGSYRARAAGELAGTLHVDGIARGVLELAGPHGPRLRLEGEALEVRVVPDPPPPERR